MGYVNAGTNATATATTTNGALAGGVAGRATFLKSFSIEKTGADTTWEIYDGPQNTGMLVWRMTAGSVSLAGPLGFVVNNGFAFKLITGTGRINVAWE